jgi:dephospho-CoA kinase
MEIFGFTGMPWSGKTEAVNIARTRDIPVFRMGDFIWEEVKNRNLPLNPDSVASVASEMRKLYGSTIWAKRTVQAITTHSHDPIIIIDGIRSIEEISYFRSHLPGMFRLIAITAPTSLRHKRAKERNRVDDSCDEKKILERDKREKKWGIDKVISSADTIITNDSSLELFQKKIVELFSREPISNR